jgi:hypothetical protein
MNVDAIIVVVSLAALILVVAVACFFENLEVEKLKLLPESDKSPEYLQELACFNFSQAVAWRRTFIASLIATAILWLILRNAMTFDLPTLVVVAVVIAVTFTVSDMYRSFHVDRVICQKATPNAPWFR